MFGKLFDKVEFSADNTEAFAWARQMASGVGDLVHHASLARGVVVVTTTGMMVKHAGPLPGSLPPDVVARMEQLIPASPAQNIAVISPYELKAVMENKAKALPFFNLLLGFAYIGHTVWVFEGHGSTLAEGCRDADLLIVDRSMVSALAPNWSTIARGTMRGRDILIFDRATGSVSPVTYSKES